MVDEFGVELVDLVYIDDVDLEGYCFFFSGRTFF